MASYIIENIIDFLTGYSVEAKILRENFIFKVKLLFFDKLLLFSR